MKIMIALLTLLSIACSSKPPEKVGVFVACRRIKVLRVENTPGLCGEDPTSLIEATTTHKRKLACGSFGGVGSSLNYCGGW